MSPERKAQLEALPSWSWDIFEDMWEEGFRHLKDFADSEGHVRVPLRYKSADGYSLGQWVRSQRDGGQTDKMSQVRKERLEALPGWSWDPFSDMWEEGFRYLKEFATREGHTKVSLRYKMANGFAVGAWASSQRIKKDKMPPDRKERLEALPGWSWDHLSDMWEDGFRHLKEFVDREGHAKVTAAYKAADGYPVGRWVVSQRGRAEIGKVSQERKERLEILPGWSWDVLSEKWEERFCQLKEVVDRENHTRVPYEFKAEDGFNLGEWVTYLRSQRGKRSLSPKQKANLEALTGWFWDLKTELWEDGFRHLKEYADREGHTQVPSTSKTGDGFRVGGWVSEQRKRRDSMSSDRKARLEALPGWSWDALSDRWEDGFRRLKEFVDREGHATVSGDCRTGDGYRLGQFVGMQRRTKDILSPERKARLEALPGLVWRVK